jgi:hypothetical protein
MNKYILIALALVVLIGGGLYVAKSRPTTPSSGGQEQQQSSRGSLRSLLGMGQNLTCTITNEDGSTGTVYVAGERVRGDFASAAAQGGMMHMIQSEGYAYLWTEGETKGMKMKFDAEESAGAQTTPGATQQNQAVDMNAEVDYSCSPWGVDASMFTLPAGVEFTDYSQMMGGVQGPSGTSGYPTANVCDQLTDPAAKAACLGAMGGNQ